jgi:hypothetical protein
MVVVIYEIKKRAPYVVTISVRPSFSLSSKSSISYETVLSDFHEIRYWSSLHNCVEISTASAKIMAVRVMFYSRA